MLLQGLLSVMRYAFYVFDVRLGAIAQGEKEMAALFGYSPEEIHALPQSWLSLVHPDDVPIHDQSQKQLMASKDGEVLTKKLRIKHKEGRWEWVTFTRQPHERDEQGHLVSELGVVQITTQQVETIEALKKTKLELRIAQERYARAVRAINDGLWDWNIVTGEDYLSPRGLDLLGYTADELPHLHTTFYELLHPEDRPKVDAALKEHFDHDAPYNMELRLRTKGGEYRWFRSRGCVERDAAGAPVRMVGSIRDITDRSPADDALQGSEQPYRFPADNTDDIVAMNDPQGGRLSISPAYFRTTGWTVEQIKQTDGRMRVHPEDLELVERARNENLAGRATTLEHRIFCSDGSWLWTETHCKPELDEGGKVSRLLVSSHDITERKEAEFGYLRELEFNRALASNTTAFILVLDLTGRVLHINTAVQRRFGYELEEVVGRSVWSVGIMDAKETERSKKRIARLLIGGNNPPIEIRMKTKSGEWLQMEISSTVTRNRDGSPERIIVTGADMTERGRLQREVLRISEREQARIGHDLHDGVGQTLTGVVSLVEALEFSLTGEARKDAARIGELAREAVQEVRRLSHGLSPAAVKHRGLGGALQLLAETVRINFRRPCECEITHAMTALDDEVEAHLFRIAQEAVTNAIRHAQPNTICLHLSRHGEEGLLIIEDDGRGLPKSKAMKASQGIGLRVMQYRAQIIEADVQVLPRKGGGVQVMCRFPIPTPKRQKRKTA